MRCPRNRVNSSPRGIDCTPEQLAGPVGTEFSIPPRFIDRTEVIEGFSSRLREAGLAPGTPMAYAISSLINWDGVVVKAFMDPATGDAAVDSAVVRSARAIRYHPGYVDDQPVCAWLSFRGPTAVP